MTVPAPSAQRFREVQHLAGVWWVSLLGAACAVLGWSTLFAPAKSAPPWLNWTFVLLAGVILPALILSARLVTTVDDAGLHLRYWPVARRHLAATDIVRAEPTTYRPIKEYGGWGVRGWGHDRAYSVRGRLGVAVHLRDGDRVLVGTQRPEALAAAVLAASRTGRQSGGPRDVRDV